MEEAGGGSMVGAGVAEEESTYSSPEHITTVIDSLEQLRVEGSYTDITIQVDNSRFPCHKVVLASGSPYFRGMFASGMEESRKSTITIKQIDPVIFETVLHFIYTGKVSITTSMVQELFTQAHLFQMNELVEKCVTFFRDNIHDANCLAALTLADVHAHKQLYEFAKAFACSRFTTIVVEDDFMKLSADVLVDLMQDRRLSAQREEQVFEAAVKWLEYDTEHRRKHRLQVLECIKFPLLSQSYLMDVVVKTGYLSEEEKGRELLEEAVLYHTVPSRRYMLTSYQVTPRNSYSYVECAVLLGGRWLDGLSSDVECFRSDTQEFCQLKSLPFKRRNEFSCCSVGNEIFVSGGLRSAEFWKYDPTFDTWLRGADLNHARRRHAMAAVDDSIYVLGGFDEDRVLASIEMWDRKSNKWEDIGELATPIENMGFAAYGKKVYMFGGKNSEEVVTNAVQCYDTSTKQAVMFQNGVPMADVCMSAVVLNHQIYVVGLEGGFRYSPQSDSWDILADMNVPRDFVGLAVLNEKIYAFGGRRRGAKDGIYSNVIEMYDPVSNTWEKRGCTPRSLYTYGCVRVFLSQKKAKAVALDDESRVVT